MLKVMNACIAEYGSVVVEFIKSAYVQIVADLGEFMIDIPLFIMPWG